MRKGRAEKLRCEDEDEGEEQKVVPRRLGSAPDRAEPDDRRARGSPPARRDSIFGELILGAVAGVVAERGVAGAPVELVIARAGVSRRTFYRCFEGIEDAVVAVMERTLERVAVLAAGALEADESWHDGIRAALAAVLGFFDEEPELAQVCLVESLAAGPVVREERERIVGAFRALVVARVEGEVSHASPLAAEGVHASVMGIVHTRLIARERTPLIELLGPLMGVIVGPFLDEAQVAEEVRRGDRLAAAMLAERPGAPRAPARVPAALRRPGAFRLRDCLLFVATHAGASNQEVGESIGVAHSGQVSALLARLAGMGLLEKRSGGAGRPNAWRASEQGGLVARTFARDGHPR
jgi:AcrR family transcriptional regulator